MSISTQEINAMLEQELADAKIAVQGGDGKFQVEVISDVFTGMNRVKRQQTIYKILNAHISSGVIHAVSMRLLTPAEQSA